MQGRDILILLFAGIVVYFSFLEESEMAYRRGFFHGFDVTQYENGHSPVMHDRIPSPVVTDLDGDGLNEVIVVTREPSLLILEDPETYALRKGRRSFNASRIDTSEGSPQDWPGYLVRAKTSLLPKILVTYGRFPVALATGYLQHYDDARTRQQYIAVVTQEWTVLLFDSNLRLIWETSLQDKFSAHFAPVEVTALVAPSELLVGDMGVVVVGGRTKRIRTRATAPHDFETEEMNQAGTDDVEEDARRNERKQAQERREAQLSEQEGHFSYYALDGRRGTIRWHHELSDFQQNLHEEEVMTPQRSYKLQVRQAGGQQDRHAGEMDWRQFRDSIIHMLPFNWQGPEDTRLDLSHFYKHGGRHTSSREQRGAGATNTARAALADGSEKSAPAGAVKVPKKQAKTAAKNAQKDSWVSDALSGAQFLLPHSDQDMVVEPNVIVARLAEGIEVLHLYTGRPLCKLTLYEGAYDDMNGDGVIDHVLPIFGDVAQEAHGFDSMPAKCRGAIFTGVPPLQQVANVSICDNRESLVTNFQQYDSSLVLERIEAVNPVVLNTGDKLKHAVFLTSTGRLTSVRFDGEQDWMITTRSTWNPDNVRRTQAEMMGNEIFTTVPTLSAYLAHDKQAIPHVLALGHEFLSIVDHTGEILTQFHVPEPPLAPPILADINNDRANDVIIVTKSGLYGFVLTSHRGVTLFRVFVGFLLVVLAAFWIFTQINQILKKPKYRHQ